MEDVVIVGALRTAIGKFGGTLAKTPATDLGAHIVAALLKQTGVSADQISEVILGQVLAAAAGQNPARQAAIKAGLPHMVPAMTINKVCGSGLKATHLAAQAIKTGDAEIVIAGGQENMSLAPHALSGIRDGIRMGDGKLVDTMIVDGLWDVYNQYHMGVTAENVAKQWGVSREQQDAFAAASQQKAEAAQKAGRFNDEIAPFTISTRKGDIVFDADEFPRHGTTAESLGGLRPAFAKDGTVTAGNASGLNDGAAAVLMMSGKKADQLGLTPLARVKAYSSAGVDPSYSHPMHHTAHEHRSFFSDDLPQPYSEQSLLSYLTAPTPLHTLLQSLVPVRNFFVAVWAMILSVPQFYPVTDRGSAIHSVVDLQQQGLPPA